MFIIIIVIFDEGAKLAIRVFSAQGPYTCRLSYASYRFKKLKKLI